MVVLSAPVSAVCRFEHGNSRWEILLSWDIVRGSPVAGFRQLYPNRSHFSGWYPIGLTVVRIAAFDEFLVAHWRFGTKVLRFRWFRPRRTVITQDQIADESDDDWILVLA